MADNLKGDIVSGAFSKLRISGITVNPSSTDAELGLKRLEDLTEELLERNINIGYMFEDNPDPNTPHNVSRGKWDSLEAVLAYRLQTDYGKGSKPDPVLVRNANAGISHLSNSTAERAPVQYPARMPRGKGSRVRWGRWNRYFKKGAIAPISGQTKEMYIGDVWTFTEHFESYLVASEDIASYTIVADTGLTILSDSLSSPDITYQIQADGSSSASVSAGDALLQVKIIATTTASRIETRIINFRLLSAQIAADL